MVGLAAAVLEKRDPQAIMAIQTSDHYIRNHDLFHFLIRTAFEVAKENYLVTLGIAPTFPSTAYGYIQQGDSLDGDYKYPVYKVKSFKEKPDQETAQQLLRRGDHSWNSGMFIWRADASFQRSKGRCLIFSEPSGEFLMHGIRPNARMFCRNVGRI